MPLEELFSFEEAAATTGTGPNLSINELTRSGREACAGSEGSDPPPREGAALTLDEVIPAAGFFRLRDVGTNAVASFLKSRNCGAAETVAVVILLPAIAKGEAPGTGGGFWGSDGWGVRRLTRCA
jgi:hypothetical protein